MPRILSEFRLRFETFLVPGDAAARSARELFADDLPAAGYGKDWTIFSWDGDAAAYRRPALDDPLGTAAGFWMIQALDGPRTIRVDDVPATGAPDAACAGAACMRRSLPSLPASTGWMLAGFPFAGGGEGGALRVAAAGDCMAGLLARHSGRSRLGGTLGAGERSDGFRW